MKLVSWNVNGLSAVLGKNFLEVFNGLDADIFCLQETKCQQDQVSLDLPGYHQYFHSAERKGYSSTAVFSRKEPISIMLDFEDNGIHPREGRVMTLEYDSFYLVNAYVPNSKEQLARLDYRMLWEEDLLKHLNKLNESKPVIYCGDLNVAHEEIDIKNPAANHFSAGFSDQEREKMTQLLNSGYTDTFRWLYPNTVRYSWWSYRFNARANNAGWRIDYFIVSDRIRDKVTDSIIHDEITGSDHCPVELDIDI